jgi:hypothetical protein
MTPAETARMTVTSRRYRFVMKYCRFSCLDLASFAALANPQP